MLKIFRNRSVKKTILISFAAIFTIPVLCNIFVIQKCRSLITENVYEYNSVSIMQIADIMDGYLNTIDLITAQVAADPVVAALLAGEPSAEKYVQLSNSLNQYKKESAIIRDLCLYCPADDAVVTSSVWMDSQSYFENYCKLKGYEYDHWKSSFLDAYRYECYINSMYFDELAGDFIPMLVYVQSLPVSPDADREAQLMILIDSDSFIDILSQKFPAYGAQTYIIDNTGAVLVSPAHEERLDMRIFSRIQNNVSGTFEMELDGQRNVVLYSNSEKLKWTYLVCVPDNLFLQTLSRLNVIVIVSYIVCVALGAAAIFFLERRNYAPIRKMVSSLGGGRAAFESGNEFDYVSSRFHELSSAANRLEETVRSRDSALRDEYLLQLLNGIRVDEAKLREQKLDFSGSLVVLLQLTASNGQAAALHDSMAGLASSLLPQASVCAVRPDDGRLLLIVRTDGGEAPSSEALQEAAELLVSAAQDELGAEVTAWISKTHEGAEGLRQAYGELREIGGYLESDSGVRVLSYENLEANIEHGAVYFYPLKTENRLINLCRGGSREEAAALLQDVFSRNRRLISRDRAIAKCLCLNLFGTYVKIINTLNEQIGEADNALAVRLIEDGDLAEQEQLLLELYDRLCARLQGSLRGEQQIMQDIRSYVQEHYMEYDLSLDTIGEAFGLSAKYLSSYFKKHENVNLSDYISETRMQKARELLVSTNLSIEEIAGRVGYSGVVVFSRFFKKQEGVPPGKYRSIHRQEGE